MSQRFDIATIKQNNDILSVIEKRISLTKRGAEYYGTCPFHEDKQASLQVNHRKQIFKCFACGAGGDVIDFMVQDGYSFAEACKHLSGGDASASGQTVKNAAKAPAEKPVAWQLAQAPETLEPPTHYRHGRPSRFWAYRSATGALLGFVCRFDLEGGEKEVIPCTFRTDGKRSEWRWQGFDRPRPMYNLHLLAANPGATVLVVEGEKTADAAQAELDPVKTVVTTWPGGSMAIAHIDWSPLAGRKVVQWPDNDVQGLSAMLHIRHLIESQVPTLRIMPLDTTLPKGWDCADKEWKPGELRQLVLDRMIEAIPGNAGEKWWRLTQVDRDSEYEFGLKGGEWTFTLLKKAAPEPPPEQEQAPEPEPMPDQPQDMDEAPAWEPADELPPPSGIGEPDSFRFLGYTKEGDNIKHHFFSNLSQTIISLSPGGMSINNLMHLAPLQYWEMHFPGKRGSDVTAAINWILASSMSRGIFNSSFIRGRGAWYDGKVVVIHAGDHLIVNGKAMSLRTNTGRYVYESSTQLPLSTSGPLSAKQANRLMDVLKLMNWERDISSYLLAGWCVIAPFCGALKWRPHIWLTGAAGTGKSWVFLNIVRRLMEGISVAVQSETSEAGLRQLLGHDALPVVFDEAEGEDRKAQERISAVLGLMRAASSDDGGMITKGSAGGGAVSYKIRSCFAFASISVQVAQQSDRTRVTVLGLKKDDSPNGAIRWQKLQAVHHEVMTDDFVAGLQARTVMLLPVILKNIRTFAAAAATVIGEQRAGDQIGALLAGAYSLSSNNEIGLEEAIAWLRARDWSEEKALDRTRDEVSLLAYLMDQVETVEGNGTKYERNIGELVAIASGKADPAMIMTSDAQTKLRRLGFKVEGDRLIISNTADWVKKRLSSTPWARNHNKILMRIFNAEGMDTTRFGSGIQTRAVSIPLAAIFEPDPVVVQSQMPFHNT